ncbi:MAG: RelA/SpoT domain-containing protein [Xanthomonadales bacterium]|nr:RelA/SpoT domain-containing protein [Xanthomonadales bacterium]
MASEPVFSATSISGDEMTSGDSVGMEDIPKKLLQEFREQIAHYEEFSLTVVKLLDSLLQDTGYKYQITHRVKQLANLEEKLARKMAEGKIYKALSDIEDLAGIRVIFYLESDKNQFINSMLEEISGDLKLEYNRKASGYEAAHIIAGLGPRRLDLSEYRKFEALKCEIQVTSILYHAWAEIEHDIFYKEAAGIRRLHPWKHWYLRRRMKKIMDRHIRKASSEFEGIMASIGKMERKA